MTFALSFLEPYSLWFLALFVAHFWLPLIIIMYAPDHKAFPWSNHTSLILTKCILSLSIPFFKLFSFPTTFNILAFYVPIRNLAFTLRNIHTNIRMGDTLHPELFHISRRRISWGRILMYTWFPFLYSSVFICCSFLSLLCSFWSPQAPSPR